MVRGVYFENAAPGVDVDFMDRGVFTTRRIHRRRRRRDYGATESYHLRHTFTFPMPGTGSLFNSSSLSMAVDL